MDIRNYDVKDTTICECGHKFDIHEINGLLTIDNHGFFSNVVRTCSHIYCPKCKKETILLLKQRGQTWEILGIATPKTAEVVKTVKTVKEQPKQQAKMENKAEKNISNELVCPICNKVCKSKIGLNAHMKTHNK